MKKIVILIVLILGVISLFVSIVVLYTGDSGKYINLTNSMKINYGMSIEKANLLLGRNEWIFPPFIAVENTSDNDSELCDKKYIKEINQDLMGTNYVINNRYNKNLCLTHFSF